MEENKIESFSFQDVEREYFETLYKMCAGNMTKMSNVSGLSRATVYRKLKDFFGFNFRQELGGH